MKTLRVAVAIVTLPLLVWLWHGAVDETTAPTEDALQALDDLSIAEGALLRDVLSARAGTLRNYDPLVLEVGELHAAVDRVRGAITGDAEITAATDRLALLVDQQDRWTERFKSDNALLQNSLAQFGFLSARMRVLHGGRPVDRAVTALAAAILQLTLDTSPATIAEVGNRLADLSAQHIAQQGSDGGVALLHHASLLRTLLPAADEVVKSLVRSRAEPLQESVRALIVKRKVAAEARTQHFRYALFATALLVLGLIAYAGGRLRGHNRALTRRAAFEHVLATLSTRLIDSCPEEIQVHVEAGLADLAACLGADRAYFILRHEPGRSFQWSHAHAPMPHGWPRHAVIAASHLGNPGSAIQVCDVNTLLAGPARDVLRDAGVRSWMYVERAAVGERTPCALGFDVLRPGGLRYASPASLLHMALDAIANSLNRESFERERAHLEASLQQARRMETIGALSSGIAHNFNNIVGAILGYTERAHAYAANSAGLASNLSEIRRAGERGRDLVEHLLTFGSRGGVRCTRLSIDTLVAEATSQLDATLPAHTRVTVHGAPSGMTVSGDATLLQQVIVNVCNNAVQATDHEGPVDIHIEARDVTELTRLKEGQLPPGQYVLLMVSDTGRGMSQETLGRLFEPFFTTRVDGNGLGLATVRQIVLEHGGAIDVRSTPAAGTCFEIWLPRVSQAELVSEPDVPHLFVRGRGETVLVIESDRERLLRCEELLAALGYEPVGFTDLREAALASKSDPTRFDLALICSHSPGPNALIERVRSLRVGAPQLPIIVASVSTADFSVPALTNLRIAEVLHHPVSSAEIAAALARCLAPRSHSTTSDYYDRSYSRERETSL